MDFLRSHLLSIVTYTPLVGALVLLLPPFRRNDAAVRWVANGVGLLGFLVSLPLWFWFDREADGFQFVEKASWIPSIGVQYLFGVDGVSALLILLTTLLGFIAILCSWTAITERARPAGRLRLDMRRTAAAREPAGPRRRLAARRGPGSRRAGERSRRRDSAPRGTPPPRGPCMDAALP